MPGASLLPPRHAAHVGQPVRDALVAVDARLLAGEQVALVRLAGARRLLGQVHGLGAVAVAAFQRVVRLHARPFVDGEFEPLVDELFARVDGAEQVAPDLLGRLHLAGDLVGPVVRHVTVRTGCAHARAVGEVDRALELLEHVAPHLVARRAEFLRVGELEGGVEGAPEQDAGDEAREHQQAQAEHRAGPAQDAPKLPREVVGAAEEGRRRLRALARRHRRVPPGAERASSVSMSTKSLGTGALASYCGTWQEVQKKRRGDTVARNWPSRSMKCVMLIMGAWDSPVRERAWQARQRLPLRSTW